MNNKFCSSLISKIFSLTDLRHPITTVPLRETIGSTDRIVGRSVVGRSGLSLGRQGVLVQTKVSVVENGKRSVGEHRRNTLKT